VAAFLGLSGDLNPLYADVEYARGGPFGEVVVPGTLVAAAAIGLGTIDGPVPATVGLVGMTWRFQRPVRVGDTIRCRWRLHRKREVENPRWGLAVWQVEVENQRGEVVATAEVTRLVNRRQVPTGIRSAKKRRRRHGVEAEAPELPPKPAPGPLREPLVEPGRWPDMTRTERPRPPQPSKPKRVVDHGLEGKVEKPPEGTGQRALAPERRSADSVPAPAPGQAGEGPAPEASEPQGPRHGFEPSSAPPKPAEAAARQPSEEAVGREEAEVRAEVGQGGDPGAAVETSPGFAPLAPEASWPPVAPPTPVTAEASEAKPASRQRRRTPAAPAAGGDASPAPPVRRRRRRHAGEPTSTSPPSSPPEEGLSAPQAEGEAAVDGDHRQEQPAAPPLTSSEG